MAKTNRTKWSYEHDFKLRQYKHLGMNALARMFPERSRNAIRIKLQKIMQGQPMPIQRTEKEKKMAYAGTRQKYAKDHRCMNVQLWYPELELHKTEIKYCKCGG